MNKEKENQEICTVLCADYPNGCNNCYNNSARWEEGNCSVEEDADKLQAANYRNADEVRKEVAKEFFDGCKEVIRYALRDKGATDIQRMQNEEIAFAMVDKQLARFMKRTFGVEVE